MDERYLHMPAGEVPLRARMLRTGDPRQPMELTLPELHLIVGRDLRSSGATLSLWEETGGEHPQYTIPWASRWLEPILTVEQALIIGSNALAQALAELFPPRTAA